MKCESCHFEWITPNADENIEKCPECHHLQLTETRIQIPAGRTLNQAEYIDSIVARIYEFAGRPGDLDTFRVGLEAGFSHAMALRHNNRVTVV